MKEGREYDWKCNVDPKVSNIGKDLIKISNNNNIIKPQFTIYDCFALKTLNEITMSFHWLIRFNQGSVVICFAPLPV